MDASLPSSLEAARVQGLPLAAYYIPDFITRDEQDWILGKIAAAPRPNWKQLTHRRLQTWPSGLVQDKLLHAPLPPWLEDPVVTRLLSLPVSEGNLQHIFAQSPHARPNHVLVNEYPPGVGIMPHKTAPRIGQSCALLLITTESLYTDHFHGISDIDEDVDLSAEGGVVNWSLLGNPQEYASGRNMRETRTSLTYRDVLSVSMVGRKLGLFEKR
ncbi:calpain [Hirsutella rhossiliensis]|uniref:Calpain n=1 Tax=Hirsutella rhossiliensis TaxID=111463 RepID=A0A9P8N327_9HYPO|nr:calpain [Hirsutella rhossiliensis]KAH0966763.1 calpain [Hirsutella rhossiliensis]